jgi:glycosyltransferase involved in cell wall biosynthesis
MSHLICHLIDANLDTAYFRAVAQHSDRLQFRVMIGSLAATGPLQRAMRDLRVPTFALDAPSRWQYGPAICGLARLLRRERVSVLHAHCFNPTLIGIIAARLVRIPFVFTRHHSEHHLRLHKRLHTRIDGWCGRRADAVIAVSETTKRIMTDVEGVPARRVTVVHNGMRPLQEGSRESIERVSRELGVSRGAVCLVLARLHEEKGHRVLFDAVPRIVARVGPLTVLLAGDGPHRAKLEADAQRRGLQRIVRFVGRRNDVAELIGLSSVIVLPSLAESFGFAALEAMSLGKPVVASSLGGLAEVVGDSGVLAPPGNAEALADAVCQVLEDPERARALGENGRRRAALFSADRMMRGYEAVYRRVLPALGVDQTIDRGATVASDG